MNDGTVIYSGPNIRARVKDSNRSKTCVVTFSSYTDDRTLDRPGFAEEFLDEQGFDAVHIITADNDWYLYPEIGEVAAAVRNVVRSYASVVSYGSSMGGYAAIRLGARFGAQSAIAISPQFSLDARVVPFEGRWPEAAWLKYEYESNDEPFTDRSIIFYEPHDRDRLHVDLYRPMTKVVDVKVPFASHPVGGVLAEVGLLKPAVLSAISNPAAFDGSAIGKALRPLRSRSAEYFFALSKRARTPTLRAELARRVVELRPNHPLFRAHYAEQLAACSRWDDADREFGVVSNASPWSPPALLKVAEYLERRGNIDGALGTLSELVRREPTTMLFRSRLEKLQRHQRDALDEAGAGPDMPAPVPLMPEEPVQDRMPEPRLPSSAAAPISVARQWVEFLLARFRSGSPR